MTSRSAIHLKSPSRGFKAKAFESKQSRRLAWEWHTDQMREVTMPNKDNLPRKKATNAMAYPHERSRTEHQVRSPRIEEEGVVLSCILRRTTMYFVDYHNAGGRGACRHGRTHNLEKRAVSYRSILHFCAFDLLRLHAGAFPLRPAFVYDGDRLPKRPSTLHRDLNGDIDSGSLSFERYR